MSSEDLPGQGEQDGVNIRGGPWFLVIRESFRCDVHFSAAGARSSSLRKASWPEPFFKAAGKQGHDQPGQDADHGDGGDEQAGRQR